MAPAEARAGSTPERKHALAAAVAAAVDLETEVLEAERLSGGDVAWSYRLELSGGAGQVPVASTAERR